MNSEISARELISTEKKGKKKKAQAENEWSNILPKSSQASVKPPRLCVTARNKVRCFYATKPWVG